MRTRALRAKRDSHRPNATLGDGLDQFRDLGAAGAAVGPRLEPLADRGDRGAALRRRLQDLVAANVEAGTDGRAAVARLGAWPSGEEPQAIFGDDPLAEALGKPGPGRGDRGEPTAQPSSI